jgi:hypothetical protein
MTIYQAGKRSSLRAQPVLLASRRGNGLVGEVAVSPELKPDFIALVEPWIELRAGGI